MSTWDETVFADDTNTDFLADCDDLEGEALVGALQDACTLAQDSDAGDEGRAVDPDYINGLCAATVAAIWSGTPFTSATVADEHPFIRGIGDGTLPLVRLARWVRQDYLYLMDYVRVLALAAAGTPTDLATLRVVRDAG